MWSSILIDYIEQKLGGIPYMFNESPFYKVNSNLRKAGLSFDMTPDEAELHAEFLSNIQFFADSLSINDARLKLRDYQKEILNNYDPVTKYLIFSSRQTGINAVMAISVLHFIMKNPGKKVILLFVKKELCEEFIIMVEKFICSLPFAHRPGIEASNKYSFKFDNGAEIETKAYNNHTAKNFVPAVYDWVILNDCGYVKEIKNYFELIESYEQDTGKKLKVWGLTFGFQYINHFCDIFSRSEKKQNEYSSIKISWRQVAGRDEQWKMNMIRALGSEEEFNKQYECKYDTKCPDKEMLTIQIPLSDLSPEEMEDLSARYSKYFNGEIPIHIPQNKESA